MAAFGVSIPDDLAEKIDAQADTWRSNRSQAIVRIFLEWEQVRIRQMRLVDPPRFHQPGPADEMRFNGDTPLFPEAA
jgi:hypothetical protein